MMMANHMHWSVAVYCPVPEGTPLSTARLELQATRGDSVAYQRENITVGSASYVADSVDHMLCTMITQDQSTGSDYLIPWVRYHVTLGFEQVLVYVEEADQTWAETALDEYIAKGKVVIVPFYFGAVSDKREFIMQGAMENHCLQQAKGRAKWVGHFDVDEYLDIRTKDGKLNSLSSLLSRYGEQVAGVQGRSMYWGASASNNSSDSVAFPCGLTCRANFYFSGGTKSKMLFRPDHVIALFPHKVTPQKGYEVAISDPDEFRVNHFKQCDKFGQGCSIKADADWWLSGMQDPSHGCIEDHTFQEACTALGWHTLM